MAFNLADAAGLDQIMSNLDTMEVVQLPLDKLDPNEKNFFVVEDVQDLAESIQVSGILQPLNVVRTGDRYRIIAGHRRFKAAGIAGLKTVPAIILPDMTEAMEWFMLIKTNTTARELSHAERAEAAIRMKKQLVQLKQEGANITGRLRDIVSEQLEISKTELARMEVIDKNLIPEAKELWKAQKMSPSAAYAMARTSPECQQEILDQKPAAFVPEAIRQYSVRRSLDWLEADCPYPSGWMQTNEKRQGRALPCPAWENVKRHKDKGHPENCPGCCAKCESYKHGYRCPDVCTNFKDHFMAQAASNARQKEAAEKRARMDRAKEHFKTTPFVNIGKAVLPLVERCGIRLEDIADWWSDHMCRLLPPDDDFDPFDEGHVASMLHAETVDDVDWPLAAFVAFCEAVNRSPNALLGYDNFGWHPYPATCPDNGQAVIVFRKVMNMVVTGDYIFYDGAFYINDEDLDPEYDEPANVPGVTAWIEFPEK